ncbi:ABC transporter permease [Pseudonocardia endophytica]|uniref:Peptide/nickel transport system permease protein n=1 Tax=Pseudonocardia endophytica TaxID=401976 RepID=A0A4R1HM14_PSEEN|nr:ABC transporter permease [Pseudonocardia endophytica]TCK22073.1 peptide/nickel transport system permease protein [Pseudonocardia endophytica]
MTAPDVLEPVQRAERRPVRVRPGVVVSVLVLLVVAGWAVLPDLFTGVSPIDGSSTTKFRPPSWAHPFGTDQIGRDLFARVVHGAGPSLQAALIAITLALGLGVLFGLLAGFLGGWVEAVIMRVVEVLLSIPPVLLSLTIISAIGFGTVEVAVAVGLTSVAAFTRLMRGEVLRIRTAAYVEAAIMCGTRWWSILPRYVLPASVGPVLALAALDFGLVVLAVSSLSFLGFGQPPPAPEWGSLVADGRNYLATAWWLTVVPGAVVAAVVLAANRLSRLLDADRRRGA